MKKKHPKKKPKKLLRHKGGSRSPKPKPARKQPKRKPNKKKRGKNETVKRKRPKATPTSRRTPTRRKKSKKSKKKSPKKKPRGKRKSREPYSFRIGQQYRNRQLWDREFEPNYPLYIEATGDDNRSDFVQLMVEEFERNTPEGKRRDLTWIGSAIIRITGESKDNSKDEVFITVSTGALPDEWENLFASRLLKSEHAEPNSYTRKKSPGLERLTKVKSQLVTKARFIIDWGTQRARFEKKNISRAKPKTAKKGKKDSHVRRGGKSTRRKKVR